MGGQAVFRQVQREIETNKIKYVLTMPFTHKNDFKEDKELEANTVKLIETVDGVFMTQVVPNDQYFDPAERAARLRSGSALPRHYGIRDYIDDNQVQTESLHRLADLHSRVQIIDPSPYLCSSAGCDFHTDGVPNYFDAHHLSPTGAKRLEPMFTKLFDGLRR